MLPIVLSRGMNQPIGITAFLFGNYIVSHRASLVKYLFNYFYENLIFIMPKKSCLPKIGRQLVRACGSAGDQSHGAVNAANVGNESHCRSDDQHSQ